MGGKAIEKYLPEIRARDDRAMKRAKDALARKAQPLILVEGSRDRSCHGQYLRLMLHYYTEMVPSSARCVAITDELLMAEERGRVLSLSFQLSGCVDNLIRQGSNAHSGDSEIDCSFSELHWETTRNASWRLDQVARKGDVEEIANILYPNRVMRARELRPRRSGFLASRYPPDLAGVLLKALTQLWYSCKHYDSRYAALLGSLRGPVYRFGLTMQTVHSTASVLLGNALAAVPVIHHLSIFMLKLCSKEKDAMRKWMLESSSLMATQRKDGEQTAPKKGRSRSKQSG